MKKRSLRWLAICAIAACLVSGVSACNTVEPEGDGEISCAEAGHDFRLFTTSDSHMQKCTRCSEIKDEEDHEFTDGICKVCGYEQAVSTGLEFTLKDGGCELTSSGDCLDYDVVIPDTYQGVAVTAIGESAFANHNALKSVKIPDTVKTIGKMAFSYCYSLKNVTLPSQLEDIGMYAFQYCAALESIEIPDGVIRISAGAFLNCIALKSIVIPKSVTVMGADVFIGCEGITVDCEADAQPSDWSVIWNMSSFDVVWGYKGEN